MSFHKLVHCYQHHHNQNIWCNIWYNISITQKVPFCLLTDNPLITLFPGNRLSAFCHYGKLVWSFWGFHTIWSLLSLAFSAQLGFEMHSSCSIYQSFLLFYCWIRYHSVEKLNLFTWFWRFWFLWIRHLSPRVCMDICFHSLK